MLVKPNPKLEKRLLWDPLMSVVSLLHKSAYSFVFSVRSLEGPFSNLHMGLMSGEASFGFFPLTVS